MIRSPWVRGQHHGFAHAVTFQHRVSGTRLPTFKRIDQHGGRARDKQAHARAHLGVQTGHGQQARVKRGYAHEHSCARHIGQHTLRIKPAVPQHGAAVKQSAMYSYKQTVDMKNGQGMNQHIAAFPAPVIFQDLRIAQQIAVTEHGTFAAARGAAGVDDGGQINRLRHHRRMLIAVVRRAL